VYKRIPIGSPLTKNVLRSCEQIFFYENELILWYDNKLRWDGYAPHLLFYDMNLKFYAATFFASPEIVSLKNHVIEGFMDDSDSHKYLFSFRNDLPKKYSLKSLSANNGIARKSNKIVDQMVFDSNKLTVKLHVRKSKDVNLGLELEHHPMDSTFLKPFNQLDTLDYKLSNLHFNRNRISVLKLNNENQLVEEWMYPVDKQVLNDFYDQLWLKLQSLAH
jgi:hypothetical protein